MAAWRPGAAWAGRAGYKRETAPGVRTMSGVAVLRASERDRLTAKQMSCLDNIATRLFGADHR